MLKLVTETVEFPPKTPEWPPPPSLDELLTNSDLNNSVGTFWRCPICLLEFDSHGPLHCESVQVGHRHTEKMKVVATVRFSCEWGHSFDVDFLEGKGVFTLSVRPIKTATDQP